jgi:hypothetical protein
MGTSNFEEHNVFITVPEDGSSLFIQTTRAHIPEDKPSNTYLFSPLHLYLCVISAFEEAEFGPSQMATVPH